MIDGRALLMLCIGTPMVLAAQQASFTTGGGVARVDQLTSGPIGTLAADVRYNPGPLAFMLTGSTINHQNLGSTNRVRSNLMLAGKLSDWSINAGPVYELASGVRDPRRSAWSGDVGVDRRIGRFTIGASAAEGISRPDNQRLTFGRRSARAGVTIGPVEVQGRYDLLITRDSVLRDDVFFDPGEVTTLGGDSPFQSRTRHFEDLSLRLAVATAGFDVRGTFAWRSGDDIVSQTWWRLEAALPVSDAATMVFATARQPADPVLNQRGSRAMTLGLRLAFSEDGRERLPARIEVSRESATLVRVIFVLPGGDSARVMGEMTGWRPVELEPLGRGRFAGWFLAPGGTYRVNVSLDNGPWIAPPGMPRVEDGFGGLVGLIEL